MRRRLRSVPFEKWWRYIPRLLLLGPKQQLLGDPCIKVELQGLKFESGSHMTRSTFQFVRVLTIAVLIASCGPRQQVTTSEAENTTIIAEGGRAGSLDRAVEDAACRDKGHI